MRSAALVVLKSTAVAVLFAGCAAPPSGAPMATATGPMSFFITSVGSGKGADLGGLAGADGTRCAAGLAGRAPVPAGN